MNDLSILSLWITYGYRSLAIQKKYFLEQLHVLGGDLKSLDLFEKVHESIAVPEVAGHPTGGAVDVLIFDSQKNTFIDFGTKIYDFNAGSYSINSNNISPLAVFNRFLLRKVMMNSGFAPYNGEYWHFSYGDRERAYYYDQDAALYNQIEI